MTLPTLAYLVAFNNGPLDDPASITTVASPAGTLGAAGEWTDISPWVMSYQSGGGRQHELDQFEASTVTLDLNNEDGRFNPWNTSSPYAGLLTIRKPLRVQATVGGVTYIRFTGHVDAWPTVWADPVTHFAQLHATDAFRLFQLADITSPGYEFQCVNDGAVTFWAFDDPVGSTSVSDPNQNTLSVAGIDATLTFGEAGPFVAASATSAQAAWASAAGTVSLSTIPAFHVGSYVGASIECWFNTTSTNTEIVIYSSQKTGASPVQWELKIDGTGNIGFGPAGLAAGVTTPTSTYLDGSWHYVCGTWTPTALALYVDGASVATGGSSSTVLANNAAITIGGNGTGGSGSVTVANFASYDVALTPAQAADHYARRALPQQSTDARVGRVLDANGWSAGARDLDAGASTVQAVTSSLATTSSLSHMQDCQATEGGALYMGPDGKVNFRSRQTLWSGSLYTTSQATFGDGAGDIPWSPGPNLALDDIDLYNEARGQRTGGNVQIASDETSVDTYGRSTWQPAGQLLGISDEEVLGQCQAVVNDHKTPQSRLQSITVNLAGLSAAQQQTVLGLGLLYRITAERSGVPGTAFSQVGLIEHISETAVPGEWTITFGLDTTGTEPYWILGTSQLGVDTRLAW